jgi:hypothetical protein
MFGLDVWALVDPWGWGYFLRLGELLFFFLLGGWFFTAHLAATRAARVLHSLAVGFVAVSFLTFIISHVTGLQTSPPLLLIGASLTAVGGFFFLRWVGAPEPALPQRGVKWIEAEDIAALTVGLAAAVVVAFQFDDYLSVRGSCFMQEVTRAARPFWELIVGFEIDNSQRLGNPAMVGPFYATLGMDGFRAFNMFAALLTGGYLVRLGAGLFGRLGYGIAIAAAGLFTPYFVQVVTADENLAAMTVGTLALYALLVEPAALRRNPDGPAVWKKHLVLVGLLYGAYVSSRYIQALSIPAVVYYLWNRDFGLRRSVVFRQAGALFAAVAAMVAIIVAQYGLPFEPAQLNAPFGVAEFSRSPFRAMPTAVMLPVYWINQFGIVLLAITLVGLGRWLVSRRVEHRFLVAFFLPVYLYLSWMEFFLKPNKNGIPLMLLAVGCLAFGQGLKLLLGAKRRVAIPAAVAAAGLLFAGVTVVQRAEWPVYSFAADGHAFDRPKATAERPYSDFERDELIGPRWVPNWRQYGRYSAPTSWWKITNRRPWLHDRWCTFFPLPAASRSVDLPYHAVEIDIDEPFDTRGNWVRPAAPDSDAVPLEPFDAPEHFITFSTNPTWTPDTVHVAVLRCGEVLYFLRLFDDIKRPELWGATATEPGNFLFEEGLELFRPFHDKEQVQWRSANLDAPPDGRLVVSVAGLREILFFDVLINSHEMAYWWRAQLGANEITLTTPKLFWSP